MAIDIRCLLPSLPDLVLRNITGIDRPVSRAHPYLDLVVLARLRQCCRALATALPLPLVVHTIRRYLDSFPEGGQGLGQFSYDLISDPSGSDGHCDCDSESNSDDDDSDNDSEVAPDPSPKRRSPKRVPPAKHVLIMLTRIFGSGSLPLVLACHDAGIWIKLRHYDIFPYGSFLNAAIDTGNVEYVGSIIEMLHSSEYEEYGPNLWSSYYESAAHAVKGGHLEVAKFLLFKGTTEGKSYRPFHWRTYLRSFVRSAAARGWISGFQTLFPTAHTFAELADIDREISFSPMLLAAKNGHIEMVQWLVEQAGLDTKDHLTKALGGASMCGSLQLLDYLVSRSVDLDGQFMSEKDMHGGRTEISALRTSSELGHLQFVQALIAHGASVNLHANKSHLHWTLAEYKEIECSALSASVRGGQIQVCEFLLSAKADASLCENYALHLAAYLGRQEILRMLLDLPGVSVEDVRNEQSLLENACIGRKTDTIRLLRQRGASVTSSALMHAVAKPEKGLFTALLADDSAPAFTMRELYASPQWPASYFPSGTTPLAIAVEFSHWTAFWELAERRGADLAIEGYDTLTTALWRCQPDCIRNDREELLRVLEFLLAAGLDLGGGTKACRINWNDRTPVALLPTADLPHDLSARIRTAFV
ncbi:hypothetical protein HDU86_008490 [Geranomyces michiganensis]|nr:hypothetical protein HDU86_008490 [Geranomyces michiganensis]